MSLFSSDSYSRQHGWNESQKLCGHPDSDCNTDFDVLGSVSTTDVDQFSIAAPDIGSDLTVIFSQISPHILKKITPRSIYV